MYVNRISERHCFFYVTESMEFWDLIKGHFTNEPKGPWPLHSQISHWSKRPWPSKVTSHLEVEGLRIQRYYGGWKIYMDSYMTDYIRCFMVYWNVHQVGSVPSPRSKLDANSNKLYQLSSWYSLWMRVKSPHNYMMVMTRGSCVKWPKLFYYFFKQLIKGSLHCNTTTMCQ